VNPSSSDLKTLLDATLAECAREEAVSYLRPDPILVARRYREPYAALLCALYAYGRADAIVRFLDTLDFSLLDAEESVIREALQARCYRFQNAADVTESFVTLARFKRRESIEAVFSRAYGRRRNVVDGLNALIETLKKLNDYDSRGYRFLFGKPSLKRRGASPMKRWMMFLRWMVRDDGVDFGLWRSVDKADLLMPLDTHTFNVSHRFGLLRRKTCDLQAAVELTDMLRTFDATDPVKYDFALYRLGQEKRA